MRSLWGGGESAGPQGSRDMSEKEAIDQKMQNALELARVVLATRDWRHRQQAPMQRSSSGDESLAEALLKRDKHLADALAEMVKLRLQPIPMILPCPTCHKAHVDEGEWATKPHHKHLCAHCGAEWYPARVPTVGVFPLPPA